MPILKATWRDTCRNDLIPLGLSTVVHTSLILVLAMCVSAERPDNTSTIQASFGGGDDAPYMDFDNTIFDSQLIESGEASSPFSPQGDLLSLNLHATGEIHLETPDRKSVV